MSELKKVQNDCDKSKSEDPVQSDTDTDMVYLGIDIGRSMIALSASTGGKHTEPSLVAYSGDVFPEGPEGSVVFYGTDALEQDELDIKEPVSALFSNNRKALPAVRKLLEHCITNAGISHSADSVCVMVTIPPEADDPYKRNIIGLVKELFSDVMVTDGLFSVAYGANKVENSIFVDIGASSTNICCISGNLPESFNCLTIDSGVDDIEKELIDLLAEEHEDLQVTRKLAREWVASSSYIGDMEEEIKVDVPFNGSVKEISIGEEISLASEYVLSDVVSGITRMLSMVDSAERDTFRNNIHVCGGGSMIRNIDCFIENELKELGGGKVSLVKDPVFAGATGAMMLAERMPAEFWEELRVRA